MTKLIKKINDQISIDKITYVDNFEYKKSHYASMDFPELGKIDLFNIVSDPAKNSSQTTKNELLYLQRLTKNLSKSDVDLVYKVDDDPMYLFKEFVFDNKLEFPTQFFTVMYYTCVIAVVDHLKYFYNRARPYQLADYYNIKINRIVTKTHGTPAYPSGHTMYAGLIAEILADKYPKHSNKLNTFVDMCGKARELQGVHYPSDNEASKKIIKTIYPQLKKYYTGVGYEL